MIEGEIWCLLLLRARTGTRRGDEDEELVVRCLVAECKPQPGLVVIVEKLMFANLLVLNKLYRNVIAI